MKKTHYEKLGVTPDADPAEIKRAYRAKSKSHHPDKGGDTGEFATIVKAYEVLSNPERRQLYDATGEDQRKPIEAEVQGILLQVFAQALAHDGDIPIVETVRKALQESLSLLPVEREKLTDQQKRLENKRDRVTSDGPVNVVHLIIDGELKGIEAKLARLEHDIEVTAACIVALDSYSEDWQAPQVSGIYFDPNYWTVTASART